jgi:pyridoxamine 5'-phosphate oxidase
MGSIHGNVGGMADRLSDIRTEYETAGIDFSTLDPDAVAQFRRWFDEAIDAGVVQANAMILATSVDDRVSARAVLLKGYADDGFVFFTNQRSDKGDQLAANPQVSLTFLWLEIHRQVRIEGRATPVNDRESDEYFASRPRGAQLAAAVSPQSRVVKGRDALLEAVAALDQRLGDRPVPRPPHWGGYRVEPGMVEFWQGRVHRMHDRARYTRADGGWLIERLAP